jgi:pimeloyl-ACP methyl ester carboxylesterase
MWDEQFAYFAQKYRVVRYDLRGCGRSAPVAGDYERHEDLRALLDFLHIDRATLMGCSMGGGACLNLALDYPDRATALIMVGSGPSGFSYPEWSPGPLDEALEEAEKAGDLERLNEIQMRIFIDGTGRTPDQVSPALRNKVLAMNRIALHNQAQMGRDLPLATPAAQRLHELRLPVLIVYGDLDEDYIHRAAAFMASSLPDAQKVMMPGTAHLPNMEFPAEFNAHVDDFLGGVTQ